MVNVVPESKKKDVNIDEIGNKIETRDNVVKDEIKIQENIIDLRVMKIKGEWEINVN